MSHLFSSASWLEFVQVTEYYRNISPRLKDKFRNAFDDALQDINDFPEAWPQIENSSVRSKPIRGYPYSIIYLIDPDAIYIIAVAHQHKEPMYWIDRLREPGRG